MTTARRLRRQIIPEPLTEANRTSNGTASGDDLVRLSLSLLGAVNGVRDEMVRGFAATNDKLDDVCVTVNGLVTDKLIGEALKAQTKEVLAGQEEQAVKHKLDLRWRMGIVIAAGGGVCGAVGTTITVVKFATGH